MMGEMTETTTRKIHREALAIFGPRPATRPFVSYTIPPRRGRRSHADTRKPAQIAVETDPDDIDVTSPFTGETIERFRETIRELENQIAILRARVSILAEKLDFPIALDNGPVDYGEMLGTLDKLPSERREPEWDWE
jgi:hypothetical protein